MGPKMAMLIILLSLTAQADSDSFASHFWRTTLISKKIAGIECEYLKADKTGAVRGNVTYLASYKYNKSDKWPKGLLAFPYQYDRKTTAIVQKTEVTSQYFMGIEEKSAMATCLEFKEDTLKN